MTAMEQAQCYGNEPGKLTFDEPAPHVHFMSQAQEKGIKDCRCVLTTLVAPLPQARMHLLN